MPFLTRAGHVTNKYIKEDECNVNINHITNGENLFHVTTLYALSCKHTQRGGKLSFIIITNIVHGHQTLLEKQKLPSSSSGLSSIMTEGIITFHRRPWTDAVREESVSCSYKRVFTLFYILNLCAVG